MSYPVVKTGNREVEGGEMKIVWHDDKKDCIDLIAETENEVNLFNALMFGVNGHQYKKLVELESKKVLKAWYSVIPDENE
jgi:hypothetical protein